MTKEEVIKQAYGEHWETVKDFVDENGWTQKKSLILNFKSVDYESKKVENQNLTYKYRPKSLSGLETNNGWIKIESEQDLPKSGYYDVVLRSNGEITRASILTHAKPKAMVAYISHYQPILEREKPLY